MRNARLAEWILSVVTDPARASATVGDALEESPAHHPLWFWATIAWTALSYLTRDLKSNSWRMTRLAALGLVVEGLLIGASALVIGLVAGAATLVAFQFGFTPAHPPIWVSSPPTLVFVALGWVLGALAQFQVGQMLARRSPGQELAPCAAMSLLATVLAAVLGSFWGPPPGITELVLDFTVYQAVFLVPLFAGAIMVRRRRQLT